MIKIIWDGAKGLHVFYIKVLAKTIHNVRRYAQTDQIELKEKCSEYLDLGLTIKNLMLWMTSLASGYMLSTC